MKNSKVGFGATVSRFTVAALALISIYSASSSEEFMFVDKIEPGMRGIGKTVFSGTDISEFEVEVLGVLKNIYPKGDLILVRLKNELLDKTGLVAGMSGSPVYIDGKLIGAISYGWGFTKETIGGVTPIEEMLSLSDLAEETKPKPATWHGKQFSSKLTEPISIGKNKYEKIIVNTRDTAFPEHSASTIVLNAIATPITAGGFNPQVVSKMEPVFEEFGLMPVQGSGAKGSGPGKLIPGGVVGVQLVSGDCELTAHGTVTYVDGNKMLAFGHPFLAEGKADIPMTDGTVLAIVPSQAFSFKVCTSGDVLGRIATDTLAAIGGETGKFAKLIPARMRIRTESAEKEFNYEMIHDEFWSPNLMYWCMLNSILAAGESLDKSAKAKLQVNLRDIQEPIVIENTYSKFLPLQPANASAMMPWHEEFARLLNMIMANQFEEVQVQNIDLDVELTDAPVTATIESIRVNKSEFSPGEDVNITVTLKTYGGEEETLKTTVTLPEDLPDGQLRLLVCDAMTSIQTTAVLNPEKLNPRSFEQLVELLEGSEKNNEIAVRLFLPRSGITVRGQELPSLPGSLVNIMTSPRETGIGMLAGEIRNLVPTSWVIFGSHELELTVRRR